VVLFPTLDRHDHHDPSTSVSPTRTPADLLRIARELAVERDRWLALVEHRPDERWFARVVSESDHDVWLIGWDSFQGVDLHDHGGAVGALYVVDGTLQETSAVRGSRSGVSDQTLHTGTARAFGVDHVHRVVNPSARPATSSHVYSPPLVSMNFYRPTPERGIEHLYTEAALAPRSGPAELR
jgi:Cysteine dioxygenase type I